MKCEPFNLSYLGAERTMPNYNVMGLAKASLEANTRFLAASLGKRELGLMRFQQAQSKLLLHQVLQL